MATLVVILVLEDAETTAQTTTCPESKPCPVCQEQPAPNCTNLPMVVGEVEEKGRYVGWTSPDTCWLKISFVALPEWGFNDRTVTYIFVDVPNEQSVICQAKIGDTLPLRYDVKTKKVILNFNNEVEIRVKE
ncbi:MAG: hypothetical protein PHD51_00880 [Patescibacteria group bacterium]|nr:hypothetical protein [Patescibacteria group bacterium]MDD5490583.1 hypothetical protein [Patescibacteria group bacterium]